MEDQESTCDAMGWSHSLGRVDMQEIVDIRNAADYLIIDELDELCCRYLAEGIADKTAEELCDLLKFDIPFATEEREEIDSELRNESLA